MRSAEKRGLQLPQSGLKKPEEIPDSLSLLAAMPEANRIQMVYILLPSMKLTG